MEQFWAQTRQMTPPCPPPSPRHHPHARIEDIESSMALSYNLVSLGAELESVSSLERVNSTFTSKQQHPRESAFASRHYPGHGFDPMDPSIGMVQPCDDDNTTVYDASSPATSRCSETDTILECPTMYRDKLRGWKLGDHRTSARSYHELWPSSPASLIHTMPTTSLAARNTHPPSLSLPRRTRASCPQCRGAAAHISPPILNASTVSAAEGLSLSPSASARTQSWPGMVSYCPHREVPLPPQKTEQSNFDAYSDDDEDVSTDDARGRETITRIRRSLSNSFQRLLCRSG